MLALVVCVSSDSLAGEIVILKAQRTLDYSSERESRRMPIALGSSPAGRKERRGDRKTPEGVYFVTHKNPASRFFLSLGLSYPNVTDANAALRSGLISKSEHAAIGLAWRERRLPPQTTALGGDIFIHGRGAQSDWTWGCVALNDDDMKFLFQRVKVGDRVTILP